MYNPSIAEEQFARTIAFWHGQKIIYRDPRGGTQTVASWRGFNLEGYVNTHWREYIAAAQAILEAR